MEPSQRPGAQGTAGWVGPGRCCPLEKPQASALVRGPRLSSPVIVSRPCSCCPSAHFLQDALENFPLNSKMASSSTWSRSDCPSRLTYPGRSVCRRSSERFWPHTGSPDSEMWTSPQAHLKGLELEGMGWEGGPHRVKTLLPCGLTQQPWSGAFPQEVTRELNLEKWSAVGGRGTAFAESQEAGVVRPRAFLVCEKQDVTGAEPGARPGA